jgi:hypothetical protein
MEGEFDTQIRTRRDGDEEETERGGSILSLSLY